MVAFVLGRPLPQRNRVGRKQIRQEADAPTNVCQKAESKAAWKGTLALRAVFSRHAIDAIMKVTILRYHTPQ